MKIVRPLPLVTCLILCANAVGAQLPLKNHSFTINAGDATICLDGAMFVGMPSETSALGLPMTGQVFDQVGTMLLGSTAGTFTFTAVGQMHTFTVDYPTSTFSPGDFIGLSVSDVPGLVNGNEGFFVNTQQVADCMLPVVPSTPTGSLLALVLLLLASGALLAKRAPRAFASTRRPPAPRTAR